MLWVRPMRENVICGSRKFAEGELRRGFTRSQRKPQITVCLKSRLFPSAGGVPPQGGGEGSLPMILCTKGLRWRAFDSGDYRVGVTRCSIPNQTEKPYIADGTSA